MNGGFDLRGYANGPRPSRRILLACSRLRLFAKSVQDFVNMMWLSDLPWQCLGHFSPKFGRVDEDILLVIQCLNKSLWSLCTSSNSVPSSSE